MGPMATWCFFCDAPVEEGTCPTCGRPPTVVAEQGGAGPSVPWWYRIPRRTWVTGAMIVAVVLYTLFESGFRLVD